LPLADDFEQVNASQDSEVPDFEEHMEGEIEDLISDPEEEQPIKKGGSADDDWKPELHSDDNEIDSWAEDEEEDGILAAKSIKTKVPQ